MALQEQGLLWVEQGGGLRLVKDTDTKDITKMQLKGG